MAGTGPLEDEQLLAARLRVPEHVVYRPFAAEMVVLNLDTGLYHGLNPTAGQMLLALDSEATVSDAVDRLGEEYGRDRQEIEADVLGLSRDLLQRGLMRTDEGG